MLSFFYSFERIEKDFQVLRRISIFVNLSGISRERCSNERFSLPFSSLSSKESNRFSELQHEFSVLSVCNESEIRDVRIVSFSYLFPSEDDRKFFTFESWFPFLLICRENSQRQMLKPFDIHGDVFPHASRIDL